MYRTHNCGELTIANVGEDIVLSGWLNNVRDKGSIIFFTLRDHYGVTQVVIADDENLMVALREIPRESTVMVKGKVVERSDVNTSMPTGHIEIVPSEITVLGKCVEALPFEIAISTETREDLRLKYRYLDLRNPKVHDNIVLRSQVIQSIRTKMIAQGFMEIQTPILTSSSPEGARDFIVPSRLNPGRFYALPQAPQQFKQLLMLSGFDRYFQIAPCFRDEDARADRSPGEFYQLDVEMAFATQDDVFAAMESLMVSLFTEFSTKEVSPAPFVRIPYVEAMEKYGSDKPDLRNPLLIKDVTSVFKDSEFKAFVGQSIQALVVPNAAASPRKLFDRLTTETQEDGAKGLVWMKVAEENGQKVLVGSVVKFLKEEEISGLIELLQVVTDDVIFMIADERHTALKLCGSLRNRLGKTFGLIQENQYIFCWIVDFPMFERNEDTGAIDFSHNPFSMPQGGLAAISDKTEDELLEVKAYQYDIICNGYELSSGAVRNHSPELMLKAFELAGYSHEVVESKFPALFNAFKHGAPPHAGIAPGVDRMIMLLANEPNIREIIAFPMNKNAQDLLMNAPSEVTSKQLEDVHIMIKRTGQSPHA